MPTLLLPGGESRTPQKRLARVVANKGATHKEAVLHLKEMGYRGRAMLPFYDALIEEVNKLPPTTEDAEKNRRQALVEVANKQIMDLLRD